MMGRETDRVTYRQKEKETKNKIKNAKNRLEREVIRDAKENPKRFYAYVNEAKKTRPKIGPLKRENGEIVVDEREQAELLNQFFASVFTKSEGDAPNITVPDVPQLSEIGIEMRR